MPTWIFFKLKVGLKVANIAWFKCSVGSVLAFVPMKQTLEWTMAR
jgi:hypothetical protein